MIPGYGADGDHAADWDDPLAAPDDWAPADLGSVWDEDRPPPAPSVVPVDGTGSGLFYRGKINALWAPSGSGKSWVALLAVLHAVRYGVRVVVVDFEDHQGTFVGRLKQLGAPRDQTVGLVRYVSRPGSPVTEQRWDRLLGHDPALLVVDGLTGWFRLHGLDGDQASDCDEFGRWMVTATQRGACVLTVDQTSKPRDAAQFATGSQHKRALVDGAAFEVRPAPGFQRNRPGAVDLVLWKDRPGGLPVPHGKVAASVRMTPPAHPLPTLLRAVPGSGWDT